MESLAKRIEQSPFIRILDSLTKLSIIVVIVTWISEIDDRAEERETARRQKIYNAWQIMSLSEFFEKTTAKRLAIEDLISEEEPLDHVELMNDNLSYGQFSRGSFNNIEFLDVNLSNADFSYSSLEYAEFYGTNLDGTNFKGAKLSNAIFVETDLSKVKHLTSAQIKDAIILPGVDLPKNVVYDRSAVDKGTLNYWIADYQQYPARWEKLEGQFSHFKRDSEKSRNKLTQPTAKASAD